MIPHRFEKFLEDIVFLVEKGEIPMSRIDDAVERILRVKFISGVFEHPFSDHSLLDMVVRYNALSDRLKLIIIFLFESFKI